MTQFGGKSLQNPHVAIKGPEKPLNIGGFLVEILGENFLIFTPEKITAVDKQREYDANGEGPGGSSRDKNGTNNAGDT